MDFIGPAVAEVRRDGNLCSDAACQLARPNFCVRLDMLDNRLKMCAEMVSGKGIAVDVGTDHGHLAAELVMSGKCSKVIASDVNEKPLGSARNTIEKNGISDKVELVLSDGLENIDIDGVTDIIIAGMGGETIAKILTAPIAARGEERRFILQPMTKAEILRRELYRLGYRITEEKAVEDGDKLYVVMCAVEDTRCELLTEFKSLYGFFEEDDVVGRKYRKCESNRLKLISENLEKSGHHEDAIHYSALAYKMVNGVSKVSFDDIYNYLDAAYPIVLQESWDNSGYLVESRRSDCDTVLLSLDITKDSVNEAYKKRAGLVISHHPVIFDPLKMVNSYTPVSELIYNDIAAICMHTNVDIAKCGTNGVILKKLQSKCEIVSVEPFEELGGGNNLGWIIELKNAVVNREFGEILKGIFECKYVRMTSETHSVKRIAFCSGSGGSMLGLAVKKGCDALLTGDVKHDVWIDSLNKGFTVYDCGHFHTENPVLWEFRRALESKFPQLDVEIAENSTDPCDYI